VLFGVLMGLRAEAHSSSLRAAIAGCAFAILAMATAQFRKAKSIPKT
jgi:hypothetical protein